jgi:hypothetical protein
VELEGLLALERTAAERLPDAVKVAARLSTCGADSCATMTKHAGRAVRFRRWALAQGLVVLGGRHLSRGARGRWQAHDHVLVLAAGTAGRELGAQVEQAWNKLARSEKNAVEVEAPRSVEAVIRYALGGAIKPPKGESIATLAGWLRATKRKRLAIKVSPRAPAIQKTENSTVTPTHTRISKGLFDTSEPATTRATGAATAGGTTTRGATTMTRGVLPGAGGAGPEGPNLDTGPAGRARIRARLREVLSKGAMGVCAVLKRFAPGRRDAVKVEFEGMVRSGELREEQGRGGGRRLSLVLVEEGAAQHGGEEQGRERP